MSQEPWPDEELPDVSVRPQNERTMAMLAHIGGFFTWIIVPLIFMLTEKEENFVRRHAREALNFQIFVTIPYALSGIVAGFFCLHWAMLVVGAAIMLATVLYETIAVILASVAGYQGRLFQYPVNLRFVSDPADAPARDFAD